MKKILIALGLSTLAGAATAAEGTCRITDDAIDQVAIEMTRERANLDEGMTRAEVDAIFGCTGLVAMTANNQGPMKNTDLTLVTWNEGPHYMIAVFSGGILLSVAYRGWE